MGRGRQDARPGRGRGEQGRSFVTRTEAQGGTRSTTASERGPDPPGAWDKRATPGDGGAGGRALRAENLPGAGTGSAWRSRRPGGWGAGTPPGPEAAGVRPRTAQRAAEEAAGPAPVPCRARLSSAQPHRWGPRGQPLRPSPGSSCTAGSVRGRCGPVATGTQWEAGPGLEAARGDSLRGQQVPCVRGQEATRPAHRGFGVTWTFRRPRPARGGVRGPRCTGDASVTGRPSARGHRRCGASGDPGSHVPEREVHADPTAGAGGGTPGPALREHVPSAIPGSVIAPPGDLLQRESNSRPKHPCRRGRSRTRPAEPRDPERRLPLPRRLALQRGRSPSCASPPGPLHTRSRLAARRKARLGRGEGLPQKASLPCPFTGARAPRRPWAGGGPSPRPGGLGSRFPPPIRPPPGLESLCGVGGGGEGPRKGKTGLPSGPSLGLGEVFRLPACSFRPRPRHAPDPGGSEPVPGLTRGGRRRPWRGPRVRPVRCAGRTRKRRHGRSVVVTQHGSDPQNGQSRRRDTGRGQQEPDVVTRGGGGVLAEAGGEGRGPGDKASGVRWGWRQLGGEGGEGPGRTAGRGGGPGRPRKHTSPESPSAGGGEGAAGESRAGRPRSVASQCGVGLGATTECVGFGGARRKTRGMDRRVSGARTRTLHSASPGSSGVRLHGADGGRAPQLRAPRPFPTGSVPREGGEGGQRAAGPRDD